MKMCPKRSYLLIYLLPCFTQAIPVSGTYVWSDLARLDVVGAPPSTRLAFYSGTTMRVTAHPLVKVRPVRMAPFFQAFTGALPLQLFASLQLLP